MTDPDFNLQGSSSNVLTAYDAAMPCGKSLSKGCTQKNAIAFGQKVEHTVPINNTSIPDEDRFQNRFDNSRIKQMSITILDSKEICLDEPFELSVRPETFQKADSGTASEIKTVRIWSMAGDDASHSLITTISILT
ncbi:hypothetical protein [Salinisphaera sp. G21_0]|uniref:hypothetical protein n=1 Tax=Salinisphaera sp. G21_0 TaxID=2821094 RepID=UPI001ADC2085|nr:hypothetical protein [Salinisphaera sp. G21_0]MBO9484556.1 hypothetical protein [Salinisphaera sp. G21_0]